MEGISLIYRQLLGLLEQRGCVPIEALGKPFDPYLHEAVGVVPTDDAAEGTVVEELQKGYRMGDRILRVSRVLVAAPKGQE